MFELSSIHVHLMFNHFPIVLSVVAPLILAVGLLRRNKEFIHISLLLFVLSSLISIVVVLAGFKAFEKVSAIDGINANALVLHQSMAIMTFYGILALGILSLFVFYMSKKSGYLKFWYWTVLISSFMVLVGVTITGYYGGSIRHTELHTAGD